jgi:uncharacterized protein (TIGR02246 family)
MRFARRLVALLALAAAPLAAQAPTPAATRELDAVYAAFRDAYARLDVEAVTALYAEDALYLTAGEPPVRGRAGIRAVFDAFFSGIRADGATLAIEFRIVRRDATTDLAADAGYYRLAVVRDGRAGTPSFGRFVTVIRRDREGRFRFAMDSYSGATAGEWDAAARAP